VREGKTRRPKKPKFKKERPPDQYAVDTGWRLFIALPMPEVVQQQIAGIAAALGEHDWPVRWVAAESSHRRCISSAKRRRSGRNCCAWGSGRRFRATRPSRSSPAISECFRT
jgi:hypothetical protein